MSASDLEQRIAQLEDIEAIKKLKALYCDICDDDHNQDRIVTIFAEDGIWESKDFGQAKGHAELRKLFKSERNCPDRCCCLERGCEEFSP